MAISQPHGGHRMNLRIVGIALAVEAIAGSMTLAQGIVPARGDASPLDQPLGWLKDAKRNYGAVKDYTCILVSQEHVKGKLEDENIIEFKQRTAPYSVCLRWLAPAKSQGQHVVYVKGKNNNKMRVKSNFIGAKVIGFVSLDIRDPRVTQHSRHTIDEAGIGNMIDTALRDWESDRKGGKTEVKTAEYKLGDRPCPRGALPRSETRAAMGCCRGASARCGNRGVRRPCTRRS